MVARFGRFAVPQKDLLSFQDLLRYALIQLLPNTRQKLVVLPKSKFAVLVATAEGFVPLNNIGSAFRAFTDNLRTGTPRHIRCIYRNGRGCREALPNLLKGKGNAVLNTQFTTVYTLERFAQLGCFFLIHVDMELVNGFYKEFSAR